MAVTTMPDAAPTTSTIEDSSLSAAAIFFAVAVLLHNGDHLRRGGDSVTGDVFWLGSAAMILEVGVVAVVLNRHRLAPLAAVATGFPLALGYVFVHLTPSRTWLSDAFPGGDVSALSWAAALLEITAALALGLAGAHTLRQRGGLPSVTRARPGTRPLASVYRHPVVATMLVGNVAIFALSLASRWG